MTHYLIELYTPKPEWLELPAEQRERFLAGIDQGMRQLQGLGIEPLALGPVEAGIAHTSEHRFMGSGAVRTPLRATPCWPASKRAAGMSTSRM